MRTLGAIFMSLLPQRYRQRWFHAESVELQRGTMISGILQSLVFLVLLLYRYFGLVQARMADIGARTIEAGQEAALASPDVQLGIGMVSFLEFVFTPLSVAFVYFILEGLIRIYAAAFAGEALPTLPFGLMGKLRDVHDKQEELRLHGELVEDVVEETSEDGCVLKILTCRPRHGWGRATTLLYLHKYYQVWKQLEGELPRKYIYLLRPMTAQDHTAKIVRYDPKDILYQH